MFETVPALLSHWTIALHALMRTLALLFSNPQCYKERSLPQSNPSISSLCAPVGQGGIFVVKVRREVRPCFAPRHNNCP
ncbi:hypothetical protein QBC33DRAFT_534744 [Phialemonium atrogriseum]|uniref:Secreted protein n=1 Tax=Phialemonium atrogriseum TaxID=1093897 RepID=A0AAJ0FMK9_9PEZI|nr:uncharacterized protein QBC33DRAFT_534744 [Phialemonium atrogriseum]KAK1768373.1 hypothetical protein QBC33DRAFT_534744 [Phialemonium atrogriseum]